MNREQPVIVLVHGGAMALIYPLLGFKPVRALAGCSAGIEDARLMSDRNGRGWARPLTIRNVGLAVRRTKPADLACVESASLLFLAGSNESSNVVESLLRSRASFSGPQSGLIAGGTHGWCLIKPDLGARVIDAWVRQAQLPPEVRPVGLIASKQHISL